jgi:HD-like signal output (HDOD) protein
MRLLFVDDEPLILDGIRNALLFAPEEWTADFAPSGADAIRMLQERFYDVVVTDMQMPGVTGADVLQQAHDHSPTSIRMILSGEANAALAERGIPLAHEFVPKPADPHDLFAAIERIDGVARSLAEVTKAELLSAVEMLPAQGTQFRRLQASLAREADVAEIAEVVEQDLAIAARVLRTANSGFYGFNRSVDSVRDAVVRLGAQTISGLVLQAEVGGWVDEQHAGRVAALNEHALASCRHLTDRLGHEIPAAGLVGLLHDIGRLLLLARRPDDFIALEPPVEDEADTEVDLARIERRAFGLTHAELGAAMLEIWHTDPMVVQAVRHHHDAEIPDGPVGRLVTELRVAANEQAEHAALQDRGEPGNDDGTERQAPSMDVQPTGGRS